jgi:hypothetical protein
MGQGAFGFRLGPRLYRSGAARVIISRTQWTASEENRHVDLIQPYKLRRDCACSKAEGGQGIGSIVGIPQQRNAAYPGDVGGN